jgi:hypothetical protein
VALIQSRAQAQNRVIKVCEETNITLASVVSDLFGRSGRRMLAALLAGALLVQAGVQAVRRVGARPIVDCTPGRPFVRPSVRRTPAVKGVPRSRWLNTRGIHDQLVRWLKPKTCPSWLARETLAALPETLVLRAVR